MSNESGHSSRNYEPWARPILVWKERIQNKINKARRSFNHTSEYLTNKGVVSDRVKDEIRLIAKKMKLRMSSKDLGMRLKEEHERLKQWIVAVGAQI